MKILIRIILSLAVSIIAASFAHSTHGDANHAGDFGVVLVIFAFVYSLPTLLFSLFVLWPVEVALATLGYEYLIFIVAPMLGYLSPQLILFASHDNKDSVKAVNDMISIGFYCGIVWGFTYFIPFGRAKIK